VRSFVVRVSGVYKCAELCKAAGANADCSKIAETLAKTDVKVGSMTVVVMHLGA
jgi:hypothetical protein